MSNYITDAINIKSYNLNEADKIMVMLSKDHGLIRAVVKGAKKPKSQVGGRMNLFIANKLLLSKRKNLDVVYQADGIDTFKAIRSDITKLTYSMYLSELINNFCVEDDTNSRSIYNILYESLSNISKSENKDEVLFFVIRFQLRFMELMGYGMELDTCVKCNSNICSNIFSFCAESGGIVCTECNSFEKNNFNESTRGLLKGIQNNIKPYNLNLNEFSLQCCFNLLKNYIAIRSHRKIKTTDMIETLCF